jgi:hypothetical protein
LADTVGLEPTTSELTIHGSTIELRATFEIFKMVASVGNDPTFRELQPRANPSQLTSHSITLLNDCQVKIGRG